MLVHQKELTIDTQKFVTQKASSSKQKAETPPKRRNSSHIDFSSQGRMESLCTELTEWEQFFLFQPFKVFRNLTYKLSSLKILFLHNIFNNHLIKIIMQVFIKWEVFFRHFLDPFCPFLYFVAIEFFIFQRYRKFWQNPRFLNVALFDWQRALWFDSCIT